MGRKLVALLTISSTIGQVGDGAGETQGTLKAPAVPIIFTTKVCKALYTKSFFLFNNNKYFSYLITQVSWLKIKEATKQKFGVSQKATIFDEQ